ncbi:Mif2/CENP-C like-domain-containing protein [Pseudomassariella vexata]|uniref:CENP-C homolog n=1 Tax=Pseudomassariella vexata TaxID=1141098 RepID=A0A1Y2DXG1_9PEZI|nr:Mif2/CENP-C like-domain-containing protein [Pseudomassariella vexata]ORY63982.1 Mif2/CENP-C like-domain-containing protein [Pseudomassariella vexata]
MAPVRQAQRRNPSSQGDHVYALGKVGRRTGVTLEDTGVRDEYGMGPADGLFSSPEKETNGWNQTASDDEQDMDIDESSQVMGPQTIAKLRRERLSIPRARSPMKTNLNSPAIHNLRLAPSSSPTRGSIVHEPEAHRATSVKRRLDFSADQQMKPPMNGYSKTVGSKSQNGRVVNGHDEEDSDDDEVLQGRSANPPEVEEEDEEEEEEEESMQVLDPGGDDEDVEPPVQDDEPSVEMEAEESEAEEEEEEEVKQPRKRSRKPKAKEVEISAVERATPEPDEVEDEEPVTKKRGRSAKNASKEVPEPTSESSKHRPSRRSSLSEDNDVSEEREAKRPRTEKKPKASKVAASKAPATKGKPGRKRKSSAIGVDSPQVQRGPPPPRARGLVSLKADRAATKTTRSGRVSFQPLQFWKGERVEYDTENEETIEDKGRCRHIKIGASIKEIRRIEEEEASNKPKKRRGKPASGRSRRRVSEADEDDEDREDWEIDPGQVAGEVIYWRREHELNPPQEEDQVEVEDQELAISHNAVQMKDIKDATFRFAKTLTMPFFGTGIVDLPPHSEKRPKNARKMQMVFFVHYGSVVVTIAQTVFRITKGGHWFVPRGNHYSIENDRDRPARIFFAQGCELLVPAESQEM